MTAVTDPEAPHGRDAEGTPHALPAWMRLNTPYWELHEDWRGSGYPLIVAPDGTVGSRDEIAPNPGAFVNDLLVDGNLDDAIEFLTSLRAQVISTAQYRLSTGKTTTAVSLLEHPRDSGLGKGPDIGAARYCIVREEGWGPEYASELVTTLHSLNELAEYILAQDAQDDDS